MRPAIKKNDIAPVKKRGLSIGLLQGSATAFAAKVVGSLLSLALSIWIARWFGAAGAGLFFLSLMVARVAVVFGGAGLKNSMLKLIAAHHEQGHRQEIQDIYLNGIYFAFLLSFAIASIVAMLTPWMSVHIFLKPQARIPIFWMAAAIIPLVLLSLHAECLRAVGNIRDAQLILFAWIPAMTLIIVHFPGGSKGIEAVAAAYCLSSFITAWIGFKQWRASFGYLRHAIPKKVNAEMLHISPSLFWIEVSTMTMMWLPTLLLGIWSSDRDIGVFNMALRTSAIVSFILQAVNAIAAPKYAALYHKGDTKALAETARSSTRIMACCALPFIIVFTLFSGQVMELYGAEFVDGSLCLFILACGQSINAFTGSVGFLLMMTEHEKIFRTINVGCLLLQIILSILTIPAYHVTGAAVSTAVPMILKNVLAFCEVRRRLAINTLPF